MGRHEENLIIVESFEQGSVVRLLRERLLDPMEVGAVHEQLKGAFEASEAPNLVISLDTVSMMSSLMLSVLIAMKEDATTRGGTLCLAAPGERVMELLRVTRLDEAFAIYESADEALAALA